LPGEPAALVTEAYRHASEIRRRDAMDERQRHEYYEPVEVMKRTTGATRPRASREKSCRRRAIVLIW
jgi:hypothetical protein